ncbi:MAG: hypothetical protein R3224_05055 [Balneolaceae bacterium]|nr:hypothetical protein [Balneolaceae bacterium]
MLLFISCSQDRYTDPLTPEEALESFRVHEDFKVEIFAAEPHVLDPVEMVFDEQGNAYAMEMADYPFGPSATDPDYTPYNPEAARAGGRIRLMRDTDGDGRVDRSTIFADSIREGTSILPWKGGLLVTTAPNIIYLEDTDGDDRADREEVLFNGFFEDNFQAQITSLRYGVDNWIYASNDGRPGEITFTRKPDAPPVSVRGKDFRFRLDRGQFEPATGTGRVGRTLNDWGHRFMTHSTVHIRHAVIPDRYLSRHEHLRSPGGFENINDHGLRMFQLTPPPYWRAVRSARRQERFDEQGLDRVEHPEGYFSGASGGAVYLGDAYPEEYYGNRFTGEHAGNLVHRDVLTPRDDSPTYVASRAESEQGREFLASTDPWFRPTTFTVGPGGYLYIVDMYRQHTEHPASVPEDLKAGMDYTRGMDRGRIYRVVPKNGNRSSDQETGSPNLRERTSRELAELLAHPNHWWRINAHRLLVERQDASVATGLRQIVESHEDPRARLHALYVLESLESLDAPLVARAMDDAHPGVREHGMILSERFSGLRSRLLEGIDDPNVRVAFQATLSAGEFAGGRVVSALADALELHGSNSWFRTAVLSSEPGSSSDLLNELLDRPTFTGEPETWMEGFMESLSYSVGSRNRHSEVGSLLEMLSGTDNIENGAWMVAGLHGLGAGLKKNDPSDSGLGELLQEAERAETVQEAARIIQSLQQTYSGSTRSSNR